jgi:hypothetical protein
VVALGWGVFLAVWLGLSGCDLTPSRPEAVFALYRDRMKSSNLQDARAMLSDESRKLVNTLSDEQKLKEPPENLAILNVLDPVSTPTVLKVTDTLAMLNVRTLKGGTRLIRLTRKDPGAAWRVDISEELSALRSFLNAQKALDMMREQAGEYAASWKAFSDRIGKPQAPEQSRVGAESTKDASPKQAPKEGPKPKRDIRPEQKRK